MRDASPERKAKPSCEEFDKLVVKWLPELCLKALDLSLLYRPIAKFCQKKKADLNYPNCVAALVKYVHYKSLLQRELQWFVDPVMPVRQNRELAEQFWKEIPEVIERYNLGHIEFWPRMSLLREQGHSFLVEQYGGLVKRFEQPTVNESSSVDRPKLLFSPTPATFDAILDAQRFRSDLNDPERSLSGPNAQLYEEEQKRLNLCKEQAEAALEQINLLTWSLLPILCQGGAFTLPQLDGKNPLADRIRSAQQNAQPSIAFDGNTIQ